MAPKKETVPTAIDDKSAMLKEAFRCISGTLDFEMLAAKMNVANGEAMRKRFKRVFEKDGEPLQIVGSTIGGSQPTETVQKPKTKSKSSTPNPQAPVAPTARSTGKKRKGHESVKVSENFEVSKTEVSSQADSSAETDELPSPKKRAKSDHPAKSAIRSSPETLQSQAQSETSEAA